MTAIQHGMPGEWAKVRGTVLSLWPLFLCFIALGAFGAALISFFQFLISRRDKKKENESEERKALRYIMLYIIQERAKELILDGEATTDDVRSLREWHEVYHKGLGGNGDADKLMQAVDKLPMKFD